MKKLIFAVCLIAAALLAGCAAEEEPAVNVETEEQKTLEAVARQLGESFEDSFEIRSISREEKTIESLSFTMYSLDVNIKTSGSEKELADIMDYILKFGLSFETEEVKQIFASDELQGKTFSSVFFTINYDTGCRVMLQEPNFLTGHEDLPFVTALTTNAQLRPEDEEFVKLVAAVEDAYENSELAQYNFDYSWLLD